jgi:hypothetical protein
MKELLLTVFIFSAFIGGAQDDLYKVNSKPFLNQKSILNIPAIVKTKTYLPKSSEKIADQGFWKLIGRQEDFMYSNKTVKPFGTNMLIDNLRKPYEPLNFKFTGPIGTDPNVNYLSYMVLDLFWQAKTFIQAKFW